MHIHSQMSSLDVARCHRMMPLHQLMMTGLIEEIKIFKKNDIKRSS